MRISDYLGVLFLESNASMSKVMKSTENKIKIDKTKMA